HVTGVQMCALPIYFGQHLGSTCDHAGVTHHLRNAHHARMLQQALHRSQREVGAYGLELAARNAARHRHPHVQWQVSCGSQEPLDSLLASHVRHLMRVTYHARHPASDHGLCVAVGGDEGRLEVEVTVYQPGSQVGAFQVDHLVSGVFRHSAHRCNQPAGQQYVGLNYLVGEDVDDGCVLEEKRAAPSACSHGDSSSDLGTRRKTAEIPGVAHTEPTFVAPSLRCDRSDWLTCDRGVGRVLLFGVVGVLARVVIGLVTHSRYLGDLLLEDAHDA